MNLKSKLLPIVALAIASQFLFLNSDTMGAQDKHT